MINRVVLVGRLVRDPELRRTQSGAAVTSFTIAVDNRFARDQEKSASFLPVVCWNQTAEFVAQYLRKGNLVGVDGRLQQRSYENNTGQKVNVIEIIADSVQGLEPKGVSESNNSSLDAYEPDPAPEDNSGVDVSDDDLPF